MKTIRRSAIAIFFLILATPVWANQPVNPSFEVGTAGGIPDGWTQYSGGGQIIKIDQTPEDPAPGGVDTSVYPFLYDSPVDGSFWAGIWYDGTTSGDLACIYQQVPIIADSTGGITVQASMWDRGDGYNSQIWVGVDPTGGVDPYGTNVYWTEKWETQWPPGYCSSSCGGSPDPCQGDHVWLEFAVPRDDGSDCGQGSAVGALNQWNGYNEDTSPITAVGSQVTIFLLAQHKFLNRETVIRFDSVTTTGDWATAVVIGGPPEVSGLTTPADGAIRDVSVEYTLTDPEDADGDATLNPEHLVGAEFDEFEVTMRETTPINGLVSYSLSSDAGNGAGTGNIRLSDTADGDIFGIGSFSSITSPILVCELIEKASTPYVIEARITDLDLGSTAWAGAGIVVLRATDPTAGGAPFFAVDVRRDGTNDSMKAEFKSSVLGGTFANDTQLWANVPDDGSGEIFLQARRGAGGQWKGWFSLNGTTWQSAGLLDPADLSGTDIEYNRELTVGLFVQHNCTANFDYIISGYVPAADKAGMGDGTTGLGSDSTGVPHVFYWDAPGDLGAGAFASRVQLRLTASDVDGMGSPAETGIFQFAPPPLSGVEGWLKMR